MNNLIENEYYIDHRLEEFNKIYRVKYNKAINSSPINFILNQRGYVNLNEFKIN